MTTTVIVQANHGWPVDVTPTDPATGEALPGLATRVARDTERTFHVHSGMDLRIHEVQPAEQDREA